MNMTIELKNKIAPLAEKINSLKAAATFQYKCAEIEQEALTLANADKAQRHLNNAFSLEQEAREIRSEANTLAGFRLTNAQIDALGQ